MKDETLKAIIKLLVAIIMIPVSTVINGWVLSILWGWFIVPAFNQPSLSVIAAVGVSITIRFVTYQISDIKTEYQKDAHELFGMSFIMPFIILFIGWLVTLFL